MVERIQKAGGEEYWKVSASTEAKKDKKREDQSQKDQGQKKKDSFGETSDFVQLLAKDPRRYKSEKIVSSQIKGFTFKGLSTDREKAILEVDITLSNGSLIKGAQIALNRQEGMKFLSRKPGDEIIPDPLITGTYLTVALPQKIETPQSPTGSPTSSANLNEFKSGLAWYYYLGFAILLMAMMALIYVFITV